MSSTIRITALLALAASTAGAQVVVTPTNPQGWMPDPTRTPITGTQVINSDQPRNGNGSLMMSVVNNNSDRTGFGIFSVAPTGFGLLSDLNRLSFDWMATTGSVQSPTLRLYVSMSDGNGGTKTGQLGWYDDNVINGPLTNNVWTNSDVLGGTANNFFLRFFSDNGNASGQVGLNCVNGNRTADFDTRMQSIATWESQCNGSGTGLGPTGTQRDNLAGAVVTGISFDMGAFPGNGLVTNRDYMDNLTVGFGNRAATNYNFEVTATTATPEPASIALVATGLVGVIGIARRRRRSSK